MFSVVCKTRESHLSQQQGFGQHVASFTEEVNPRLAKRPLKTNGRLANLGLTSLVKGATNVNLELRHLQ